MKKILLLVPLFLMGCATANVQYPEVTGNKCLQMDEKSVDQKDHTCLRIQSFRDSTKWHRVKDWQVWGDMPDTP